MKSVWQYRTIVVAASILLSAKGTTRCVANPITYTVNPISYSSGFTLTGTITTDGTIGVLDTHNFLGWVLAMSDGANSYSPSTTNMEINSAGPQVMATETEIYLQLYPYAGQTNLPLVTSLIFGSTTTGIYTSWATMTAWPGGVGQLSPYRYQFYVLGDPLLPGANVIDQLYDSYPGDLVVASVVPIPEPSTIVLGGLGLIGLLGIALRRRKVGSSPGAICPLAGGR